MSLLDKIKSDTELKALLESFFKLAWASRCKTVDDIKDAFPGANKGFGFRLINGNWYKTNQETRTAQYLLIQKCIKLLGPKIGHEGELADIAWGSATKTVSDDLLESKKQFYASIEKNITDAFKYYLPNYLVSFDETEKFIQIGPVKALKTEVLIEEVHKFNANQNWDITISEAGKFTQVNGVLTFNMHSLCWEVSLHGSTKNAEEESRWLINVAISLLRLSYQPTLRNPLFPRLGDLEGMPDIKPVFDNPGMIIDKERFSAGGGSLPNSYVVNSELKKHLNSIKFDERVAKIFSADRGSVGERVAQGLGWMARGRQSEDRAERFLFFFTAIEALLSSGDKTAPVTQTIARHASVLLSNDNEARHNIAKGILASYNTRSQLVHSGRRNVSHNDAYDAQYLVEALYWLVLENVDLNMPSSEFERSLAKSSYGLKWQILEPSELD